MRVQTNFWGWTVTQISVESTALTGIPGPTIDAATMLLSTHLAIANVCCIRGLLYPLDPLPATGNPIKTNKDGI